MTTNRSEYMREYRRKNREKLNEYKRKWARGSRNEEYDKEYSRRVYRERLPQKIAINAVNRAIRLGLMERKPCEICGEEGHAHHDDYAKPYDVRWLCKPHHQEWHKVNGAGKNRDTIPE